MRVGIKMGEMTEELLQIRREWRDCVRCPLGTRCHRHVLWDLSPRVITHARSPDLLVIGEGPGLAEDTLGTPFVGPAGRFLKRVIQAAKEIDGGLQEVEVSFTNLVACRPQDRRGGNNRVPEDAEVLACRPRLVATIEALRPSLILVVGGVPLRHIRPTLKGSRYQPKHVVKMLHPSFLIRDGGTDSPHYREYLLNMRKILKVCLSVREKE